jgi:hypothetical protein
METVLHAQLRRAAAELLLASGCCAAACEVRCPISRFRVDAAGYQDPLPRRGMSFSRETFIERGTESRTVIVECKQARGDFLRDTRETPALLARRRELDAARLCLEDRIIRASEPELRRGGTSLFRELESWEFDRSRLASYRKIVMELGRIDAALHGQTKFWMLSRYRLADRLYIAAPKGLVLTDELPPSWGLLEAETEEGETVLTVRRRAEELGAKEVRRQRLLRNIAAAASRPALRRGGVDLVVSVGAQENAPVGDRGAECEAG